MRHLSTLIFLEYGWVHRRGNLISDVLEAAGAAGLHSLFERRQTNSSGDGNREMVARFRTTVVRVAPANPLRPD